MACGEFSLIARYFDRVRSSRLDVETGIGDDCALLNIPEKQDRKSTRLNSSHLRISYAVFCLQ